MKHEILLGLTTTPNSDWRGKVEEIKKFGIKRIALFPTFLKIEQRKKLYDLLAEIEGLEIPHVHLRGQDMEVWEMELFEKKYKTQVYNIHRERMDEKLLNQYLPKIYVENRYKPFLEEHLSGFAGICLDLAHLHDGRKRKNSRLDPVWNLLDKCKVGCCHVSAIKTNNYSLISWLYGFDRHSFKKLAELDYIGQYQQYLPYYISLELENSFAQQLKAKEYVEEIVNM